MGPEDRFSLEATMPGPTYLRGGWGINPTRLIRDE
jgi:hypothetical protein